MSRIRLPTAIVRASLIAPTISNATVRPYPREAGFSPVLRQNLIPLGWQRPMLSRQVRERRETADNGQGSEPLGGYIRTHYRKRRSSR